MRIGDHPKTLTLSPGHIPNVCGSACQAEAGGCLKHHLFICVLVWQVSGLENPSLHWKQIATTGKQEASF
jgi:hypothetical protein